MDGRSGEPLGLDDDSRKLYEVLVSRLDEQGYARYEPKGLARELTLEPERLEGCLHELYARGMVVYATRVNKETGEELKVVHIERK